MQKQEFHTNKKSSISFLIYSIIISALQCAPLLPSLNCFLSHFQLCKNNLLKIKNHQTMEEFRQVLRQVISLNFLGRTLYFDIMGVLVLIFLKITVITCLLQCAIFLLFERKVRSILMVSFYQKHCFSAYSLMF